MTNSISPQTPPSFEADWDGLTYICIAINSAGRIEDVELLDCPPGPDFFEGYAELGLTYQVRSGYINGGDSRVDDEG